jgi:hypothetical protein
MMLTYLFALDDRRCLGKSSALMAVLALGAAGCNFDAEGTGHGPSPQLCAYDLEPTHVFIDDAPDSGLVEDGILYDGEDFLIKWNVCHHTPYDAEPGTSEPYTTLVEVMYDGELFWMEEVESEPIHMHECRYEEVYIEEGLPAGHYTIRVEVNVDGVVYECNSQTYMDNNLVTLGINVEPIPIDDVTLPPGGDSGDPPMTPQLGAPGS